MEKQEQGKKIYIFINQNTDEDKTGKIKSNKSTDFVTGPGGRTMIFVYREMEAAEEHQETEILKRDGKE